MSRSIGDKSQLHTAVTYQPDITQWTVSSTTPAFVTLFCDGVVERFPMRHFELSVYSPKREAKNTAADIVFSGILPAWQRYRNSDAQDNITGVSVCLQSQPFFVQSAMGTVGKKSCSVSKQDLKPS